MRLVRYTYPNHRQSVAGPVGFTRSPWTGLENEIDRLFATALADLGPATDTPFAIDLYEDKENTYVRAELPGVSRQDIGVEMVEGYLNLTAVRKQKEGTNEETATYNRSIRVPEDVQADKVSAAYENGVLTVTLPKVEAARPKKVTVTVK
jgi:HSP20 family protein